MKQDIKNRNDIELLVNTFYDKVKTNNILGNIFIDLAKVDWESHLPIMYSFWASILLNEQSYKGNTMTKHIILSKSVSLKSQQFTEWLDIFISTVDELFEGIKAEEAKFRAENIAKLMQYKIEQQSV
ncbi:MAG: group III truncated hemoglobin [Saprospiraceae bacterium]|nr:group III truncated hemoglobin [Saprospiraceae bacterium]